MEFVKQLLEQMTADQKAPVVKILGLKSNNSTDITKSLSRILLPGKGLWQTPMSYNQIIGKIAVKNNEKADFSKGIANAEKDLYLKLFQNEFEELSAEEKEKIFAELEKAGLDRSQMNSLAGISALGAAQLSGFGIYVLASTTVGAITSVLGLTLPFAFYTTMSSAISFVIGPVGFLVMGVMLYRSFRKVKSWDEALEILDATWKEMGNLINGDYKRATLAFKYIAASRVILEENFKKEIAENDQKIIKIKSGISGIEIKKLEKGKEIKQVESQINSVYEKIQNVDTEISELRFKISQLENSLRSANLRKDSAKNEIVRYENSIKKIEQDKITLDEDISTEQSKISLTEKDSLALLQKIKEITK